MSVSRPTIPEFHFVLWALVLPIVFADWLVSGDGDPARHIRLGQLMIEQGSVLRRDVWSWTRGGDDFLAFEWGSEVVLAGAYDLRGTVGVAVLAGLVLAATYSLLCRFLLQRGVDPALAYVTVILGVVLSAAHWLARPHVFTFLGVMLLFPLLEDPESGRRSALLMGPLFLVWANMHGGFIFGIAMIGAYLVGALVDALLSGGGETRQRWLSRARTYLAMLAVAAPVTLINPNGLDLHRHIAGFFGLGTILEVTQEFQRPRLLSPSGALLAAVVALVAVATWRARHRPDAHRLILVAATLWMAIDAQRNIALFGLVALPMVALHVNDWWAAAPDRMHFKASFARDHARGRFGLWSGVAVVTLGVLTVVGGASIIPDEFDDVAFPVDAVEAAREANLEGRMFNSLTWGGYMLLTWPEQAVYIDGGTDHYGDALVEEAVGIGSLQPGWQDRLDDRNVTMVLLPPTTQVVHELAADADWDVWFCDHTAVLLTRTDATTPPSPQSPSAHPAACPQ